MTYSQCNGNPFPEKWTLVCTHNRGQNVVEPCDTEGEARRLFETHRSGLPSHRTVVTARIIPPDGDGEVITLVGEKPTHN